MSGREPDVLGRLPARDRERVLAAGTSRDVDDDEVIIREGGRPGGLGIVETGHLLVQRGRTGPVTIARLGPGEMFGEMSWVQRAPASATVVADGPGRIWWIDDRALSSVLAGQDDLDARFHAALAALLAGRLRETSQALAERDGVDILRGRGRGSRAGRGSPDSDLPPALLREVQEVRRRLVEVEEALRSGGAEPDEAARRVAATCDDAVALLAPGGGPAPSTDPSAPAPEGEGPHPALAAALARELHPFLMTSALMARAYARPAGELEDAGFREGVALDRPEGDGVLGPILDRWFLDRPFCRARRETTRRLADLVRALGGEDSEERRAARVLAMDAPVVPELAGLDGEGGVPLVVKQVAADPRTDPSGPVGSGVHLRPVRADPLDVLRGRARISLEAHRLIYAPVLADYLPDPGVLEFLSWARGHLEPGGAVVLAGATGAGGDAELFEHLLDWRLERRSRADVSALLQEGPLTVREVVDTGPGGWWAALER